MRLLREYLLYRLLSGRRHSRRHRARSRSSVRVGGCCLPIPLGMLAIAGTGSAALVRRAR